MKRLADSEPRPARTVGKVGKWAVIMLGMLVVAVIALALAGRGDGKAKASSAPAYRGVFAEINRVRRQAHLKPLKPDGAASNVAWHHSASMAETTGLAAVPRKDLKPFFLKGRKRDVYQVNLYFSGVGGRSLPSTRELVDYMMRAHGGRARARGVLNPNHNRVGIAITRQSSSLWATAIFITAGIEKTASVAPTCSAWANRNERTIGKGGWDRYCGPGRAVLRVDGKVFRIKHGTCHRTPYSVGFGLIGYGDHFPNGRGMDLHLGLTGSDDLDGPIRAGRNSVNDGEVQLPGYGSLPHTGRAIVAKHVKGGTFSLGRGRVTGRFTCC